MIRFSCPHCGAVCEVQDTLGGQVATCYECTQALTIPPPTALPPTSAPPAIVARVKRKSIVAGVGCLVQLIGLPLLILFPFGTIVGFALFIIGSSLSVKWICGNCGNRVEGKRVTLCPACRAELHP